mmetsp:Transcript_82848/g.230101  ORF Transcript_82848/g.230101 Transcript_82848/m.230101 type:complete len:283 (+) Transcript_82848:117-965(+)
MGAAGTSRCAPARTCCEQNPGGGGELVGVESSNPGPGVSWSSLTGTRHLGPNCKESSWDGATEDWRPPEQPGSPSDVKLGSHGEPKRESNEVILKYSDSSVYRGQALDGKRHGEGTWTCANGRYEGQWSHDLQEGQGKQVWEDRRIFVGQFSKGKIDGHGRMEWHTEDGIMVYEGQYLEDLKHGRGRFVWADSRAYDGEWVRGQRSGCGRYLNSKGEVRWGIWKDDKLDSWLDSQEPFKGKAHRGKGMAEKTSTSTSGRPEGNDSSEENDSTAKSEGSPLSG